MTFLNPGFLWFLALAGIPVIIHLINIRKYKTVYFSHTYFLQQVEEQQKARTNLKNFLVLLLRILAIVSLVLAFAHPVKFHTQNKPCSNAIIYIDNSFSMENEGKNGVNIEAAKRYAVDILKLFPPGANFLYVNNDFGPEQQDYSGRSIVNDLIVKTTTSPYSRKLQLVMEYLKNFIGRDSSCFPNVFIFSDFQKTTADIHNTDFPDNCNIYLLPLSPANTANLSIDTVFFAYPYHVLNTRDSVYFTVTNYGTKEIKDLAVKLYINDSLKAIKHLDIKPGKKVSSMFEFQNLKPGWNDGYIEFQDFPVTFDNTMYFSFFVRSEYKILFIGNKPNKYIKTFYSLPPFKLTISTPGLVPYSEFKNYNLIILYGLDNYSSGLLNSLKKYVESGGNIALIPSPDFTAANAFLTFFSLPPYTGKDTVRQRITEINLNSIIYKNAIESYEANELMPEITLYAQRYPDFKTEDILLTGNSGTYFLTDAKAGNGHIFIFSFPVDDKYTDLVYNPLFVPTFYNMAIYSGLALQPYYVIPRDRFVVLPNVHQEEYIKLSGNGEEYIPPVKPAGDNVFLDLEYARLKAGTYGLVSDDSVIARISLNYDRRESDLSVFSRKELSKIISDRKLKNVKLLDASPDNINATVNYNINATQVWKIFVILALLFLLMEIIVNRYL